MDDGILVRRCRRFRRYGSTAGTATARPCIVTVTCRSPFPICAICAICGYTAVVVVVAVWPPCLGDFVVPCRHSRRSERTMVRSVCPGGQRPSVVVQGTGGGQAWPGRETNPFCQKGHGINGLREAPRTRNCQNGSRSDGQKRQMPRAARPLRASHATGIVMPTPAGEDR